MTLKAFISYASEDKDQALRYYKLLKEEGVIPWIDVYDLLPGHNWEVEISKALRAANIFILLISPRSLTKRGFVQTEANEAIERLKDKLPTDIYVIPLLLEPCDIPSNIASRLQFLDVSNAGAWEQVKASLLIAAEQQSIQLRQGVTHGPFKLFREKLLDKEDRNPGYDIEMEYPCFESTLIPSVAKELSNLFLGRAHTNLISNRVKPWDEDANIDSCASRSARWEDFGVKHATRRLLSLYFNISYYNSGAAHPNYYFETFNYAILEEKVYSLELTDFFVNINTAIQQISDICFRDLSKQYWERTHEKPDPEQIEWFENGTAKKLDNFLKFTVEADRFVFYFSPYEVSCYALGNWIVNISFFDLIDFLKTDGPHTYSYVENK